MDFNFEKLLFFSIFIPTSVHFKFISYSSQIQCFVRRPDTRRPVDVEAWHSLGHQPDNKRHVIDETREFFWSEKSTV